MTPDKILEVVSKYEGFLIAMGHDDGGCRFEKISGAVIGGKGRRDHLTYMCAEITKFVAEGRIEKAFRWLGFMQGVLWTDGYFTVEELGRHNMPNEAV